MTPNERGEARVRPFLSDVQREVEQGRERFPGNGHLYVALAEEVGEVARALLDCERPESLRAECVQVAAMAMRLAEEGDADFPETSGSIGGED